MAAGNAIIARNVGQTHFFVKNNKNGFLLDRDIPEDLADKLENYISNEELHDSFARESIRLIKEVHTSRNFIDQIDNFWSMIINNECIDN